MSKFGNIQTGTGIWVSLGSSKIHLSILALPHQLPTFLSLGAHQSSHGCGSKPWYPVVRIKNSWHSRNFATVCYSIDVCMVGFDPSTHQFLPSHPYSYPRLGVFSAISPRSSAAAARPPRRRHHHRRRWRGTAGCRATWRVPGQLKHLKCLSPIACDWIPWVFTKKGDTPNITKAKASCKTWEEYQDLNGHTPPKP